jgi:hypothetical protein
VDEVADAKKKAGEKEEKRRRTDRKRFNQNYSFTRKQTNI